MQYDWQLSTVLLMFAAAFCASLIEFFAQAVIGMLAFWMTQATSVAEGWFFVRALFSGWIIPLAMFPAAMQPAFTYLPFRYMLSFPVEIIMGGVSTADIGRGFAVQWAWIIAFFLLYRLLWRIGLKQYSAVGA